jgi:prepilin-type N-terminal cleavage/methylation domain-containing protein
VVRREAGFTLLETVVAMTVFGVFLAILFTLTSEMRGYDKRLPIGFQKHPQVISVLSRMRRDVMDANGVKPYKNNFKDYTSSDKVLIVETIAANGGVQTVVWDFRTPGEVHRHAFNVGVADEWVARGLPAQFSALEIDAVKTDSDAAWATRIIATDQQGRIAIDTILQPRATE